MIPPKSGISVDTDTPLAGKRILVTRPANVDDPFSQNLRSRGAEVLILPLIDIVDPLESGPLSVAAESAATFDCIVFTSANAVRRFFAAYRNSGLEVGALRKVRICAIGPATARAVSSEGADVAIMPKEFVAEELVAVLLSQGTGAGSRILFPRAEKARGVVADTLRSVGADVVEVVAYRTTPQIAAAEVLRQVVERSEVDVITFTSSSAVEAFVAVLGPRTGGASVATIGPVTSRTARLNGLPVDIEALEHTTDGLVTAIERYLRSA